MNQGVWQSRLSGSFLRSCDRASDTARNHALVCFSGRQYRHGGSIMGGSGASSGEWKQERVDDMAKRGQNEGSIYKRADGRWAAIVSIDWKNGKRRRKFFYAKTRKEVQEKLTAAIRDQQLGLPIALEKQTTGQFLQWWFEHVARQTVRPKTLAFYDFG